MVFKLKEQTCFQSSDPVAAAYHIHPFSTSSMVIQSLPHPLWRGPSLHMSSAGAPAGSTPQGSSFLLFSGLIAKTCAQISPSSIEFCWGVCFFFFNCELCAQHYDSKKELVPAETFLLLRINIYCFLKKCNQILWNQIDVSVYSVIPRRDVDVLFFQIILTCVKASEVLRRILYLWRGLIFMISN